MSDSRSRAIPERLERQLLETAARERAGAMIRALGLDPLAPYGGLERLPALAELTDPGIFRHALIGLALRRAGVRRLRPLVLATAGGGQQGEIYRRALVRALDELVGEVHWCADDWQRDRWLAPTWEGPSRIAQRIVDRHFAGCAPGALAQTTAKELVGEVLLPPLATLEADLARRARIPARAGAFELQRRLLVATFIAALGERIEERIEEDRVARVAAMRRLRRTITLDQELFG